MNTMKMQSITAPTVEKTMIAVCVSRPLIDFLGSSPVPANNGFSLSPVGPEDG